MASITDASDDATHRPWGLYAAVAVAVALRVWGLSFGMPHPEARPDESVLIALALDVLRGDLNPEFFNYPSLFIYVLAGLYGLLYLAARASGLVISVDHFAATMAADPTPLYLCARLLSVACGAATVVVVYLLGRRLHSHRTGLVAAWLLAVNYLHVRESHFGVTDVPLTLLTAAAVTAAARASVTARTRDFGIAGAIAGLAVSTKYNAVLLALPLLEAATAASSGRLPRALARATVAGVAMIATALAATPFAVLDWATFQRDVLFEMRHLQVGHAGVDLGRGWIRHALFTLPLGTGVPALIAAAMGAVLFVRRRPWLGLLAWSFPVAYYVVAGSARVVFVRYMVPITPFLAVAAAMGVVMIMHALPWPRSPRSRSGGIIVAVLVLIAAPLGRVIAFDRVLSRRDSRVVAAEWLAREFPAGASIYQAGSPYEHLQLTTSHEARLFDEQRESFVGSDRVARGQPDWIVLPQSPSPYSKVPPAVQRLVARCYTRVLHVPGAGMAPAAAFDLQDAFFVPYSDPALIERPGPDILILMRDPTRCGPSDAPAER